MHRKKNGKGNTYKIGEAAELLHVQTSVLRFWEEEFSRLHPIRTATGQRIYSENDMALLREIRSLLYEQGLTIEGAKRMLSGENAPSLRVTDELRHPDLGGVLRDVLEELRFVRHLLETNYGRESS